MRSFRSETRTPTLLLERDGYQILTVLVAKWNGYTAWTLVYRESWGGLRQVASGWTRSYAEAHPAAYRAFVEHKAWVGALDEPHD